MGTGFLRSKFGSKQRLGTRAGHHHESNAGIIRYCSKALEKMGYLVQVVIQVEDEKGHRVPVCSKGRPFED